MNAAPVMAASSGGLLLSASAPSRRMLPIAQVLDRMPGLSRTQKAVLNQVCGLAENGQRKQCDATNPYLAARLRPASERTISRTLTDLEARSLLRIEGQGKARRMWPVEALRACYLTADEAEQEQAIRVLGTVANLDRNLDKTATNLATNLDKTGPQPRQNGEVEPSQPRQNGYPNLDTFGHQPRQNGSRVYRDDQYEQVKEEEEKALRSALAAAEKKIGELESENQQLAADLEDMTYQRNQLRNSLAAVRPASANASASHTRGGAAAGPKIPFAQSQCATPAGFAKLATALGYAAAYAPHYLAHIGVKAGTETRDEKGWQNFVQRFLSIDANDPARGLITTPPTDSATTHAAQRSTFPQQRPVSGAKPTSTGSQLARALAERRAGLSGAGPGHHGPATGPDAG